MKFFTIKLFSILAISMLIGSTIVAQTGTTVEKITENPTSYENDEVEVEGLVSQYVAGRGATSHYLLKGDFGGIIKVNTAEPAPETNEKYRIIGIVYLDRSTREPFISEKSKTRIGEAPPPPTTIVKEDDVTVEEITESTDNTLLYIIIGAVVILIALLIFSLNKKKEPRGEPTTVPGDEKPISGIKEAEPEFSSDNEYKTIKIVKTSPKTLKFIPGKLVITDGADKGKEFRIAGYPTPEGSIISIGRKDVKGERAYAHIRLMERTVSREQAVIISREGKLFIKNMTEVNFTQLNGEELTVGQMAEMKPGSTIRTGEVEFKYQI